MPLKSTPTSPLCSMMLSATWTFVLLATSTASNFALKITKPRTRTWRVPSTTTPLPPGTGSPGTGFWPFALITAPGRPMRASDFLITACV